MDNFCNPSEFKCGVCGKMANTMYVYGFRCAEHQGVKEPKQCKVSDKITYTYGERLNERISDG